MGFDELLEFIYEVQGYLAEQSDEDAKNLEAEATNILVQTGYADWLADQASGLERR